MSRIASWLTCCVLLAACTSPPVEAPRVKVEQETRISTFQGKKDKVDLLFMVDDSGSMKPKQDLLKERFPDLIKTLDSLAADTGKKASYHIGVITSSMGVPGSGSFVNLGGRLQALGAEAAPGCVAPVGKRYIEYDQRTDTNNLPAGRTLAETFTCMASVGTKGSGLEMPLEAVYHALRDPLPENQGFLRDDAILAVIFLTDEDDCSAEGASDLWTSTSRGIASSFRCTRYGIVCDGQFPLPEAPQASFQSCKPATIAQGSPLTDLQKYVTLLALPKAKGGLKDNPERDVVLAAIAGPTTPFGTELSNEATDCGGMAPCTKLAPSCRAADDVNFKGDPAVRLATVINAAPNHNITNICGSGAEYKTALEAVGALIIENLGESCLTSPIADRAHPDCVVEEFTGSDPNAPRTSIPSCEMSGGARPCWELVDITDPMSRCEQVCDQQTKQFQRVSVNIRRDIAEPVNSTAEISCLTIAIPNENLNPDEACLASGT